MSGPDLFFAYGTLRRNAAAHGAPDDLLEALARAHVAPARARGRLHWMGDYPALAAPGAETGLVVGDVYRIDQALWAALDEYEGGAYVREMVQVTLENGDTARAIAYIARDPKALGARIDSGDFFDAPPRRCGGQGQAEG